MIWFIGCTHWGHDNICRLADRPFVSVEEMNQELFRRWRQKVRDGDKVYHLGDVYFKWNAAIGHLPGDIVWIRGNHDRKGTPYVEVTHFGHKLILCHYPIESWNRKHWGSLHIHAHTHDHKLESGVNRFNVCVEAIGYEPISLQQILGKAVPMGEHK